MNTKLKDQGWPWNAIAWMAAAAIYVLTILIARDAVVDRNQKLSQVDSQIDETEIMVSKLKKDLEGYRSQLQLEQETRDDLVQHKFNLLAHDMKITASSIEDQAEIERKIRLLRIKQGIDDLMGKATTDGGDQ